MRTKMMKWSRCMQQLASGTIARGHTTNLTIPVLSTIERYRRYNATTRQPGTTVGLVPTMGSLHDGHLQLCVKAREQSDIVVASIFVNPRQFSANEDFDEYPRDTDRDLQLLQAVGVDAVFLPESCEMYPSGSTMFVEPGDFFSLHSEGGARGPHFFRGVSTVVSKLLNIVQPDRVYMGQKDAMQCFLVRKLVDELNFPTDVVVVPTVRESDGLAMSSRNAYLCDEQRKVAPKVFQALNAAQNRFNSWPKPIERAHLIEPVQALLESEPLFRIVDYISISNKCSFEELDEVTEEGAIISVAVDLGNVRLLDNIVL